MRWLVAFLSLAVLCALFGSAAVLVMGKPSLPGQMASLEATPSQAVRMRQASGF